MSQRRDYEAYMSALWGSHGPRVRAHRNWRHHRFENMFGYELTRLARVWRIARAVESGVPADAFTDAHLRAGMEDVSGVLGNTASLLREVDLLTLLDREYDLMAEGLRLTYLPAEELPVLGAHGIEMTRADLERSVYRVSRTARATQYREVTPSRALSAAQRALDEAAGTYESNEQEERKHLGMLARQDGQPPSQRKQPPERKQPRIFKGLGQIVQGAAMTVADVGLAVGAFPFPVSPETQSWGALASVTAGVGTVMSGVGDLRAE